MPQLPVRVANLTRFRLGRRESVAESFSPLGREIFVEADGGWARLIGRTVRRERVRYALQTVTDPLLIVWLESPSCNCEDWTPSQLYDYIISIEAAHALRAAAAELHGTDARQARCIREAADHLEDATPDVDLALERLHRSPRFRAALEALAAGRPGAAAMLLQTFLEIFAAQTFDDARDEIVRLAVRAVPEELHAGLAGFENAVYGREMLSERLQPA